ncbi:hypothetical protein PHYPSEUDO_014141 [Phytophthora pseudosyringae]|uniref:Uncharacterized protein n=1 Tax=Phytophthora pseudosyringae TaxID=221518 RepID=A0A8T1V594_9STRA|nr:hypothetical protein PHYPSEUDO_014141 [Phytophthora pseudosyringae]
MMFSVVFFSRPFDYFLSSDAPGVYHRDRIVVHEDSQWGGPEPAPLVQIRRADQLHQALYTIQDAATSWYPSDLVAVFRTVQGDLVRSLQPNAPSQLLYAMCNLYQAIFSDLFDDLHHEVDIHATGSRALSSLRHDSPAYNRIITRVMNDAVVNSVFHTASSGFSGTRGSRSPPPHNHAPPPSASERAVLQDNTVNVAGKYVDACSVRYAHCTRIINISDNSEW